MYVIKVRLKVKLVTTGYDSCSLYIMSPQVESRLGRISGCKEAEAGATFTPYMIYQQELVTEIVRVSAFFWVASIHVARITDSEIYI